MAPLQVLEVFQSNLNLALCFSGIKATGCFLYPAKRDFLPPKAVAVTHQFFDPHKGMTVPESRLGENSRVYIKFPLKE